MAYDIFILLEGNVYCKVTGVTAESVESVTTFAGETYRDDLNSAFMGSPPTMLGQKQEMVGGEYDETDFNQRKFNVGGVVAIGNDPATANENLPYNAALATNSLVIPDNQKYFEQSDTYNHVAPRFKSVKRDRYKWTTAAGLYWAWADQIIAVSYTPFGFIGATLPT